MIHKIKRLRDIPPKAWVWCDAGGYDTGWWPTTRWWDKYTIGSLTHWHPPQKKEPTTKPQCE